MPSIIKTVKIPPQLAAVLKRVAMQRGCSESELIREGIAIIAQGDKGLDMQALIGKDIGAGVGASDLSHDRKRLAGYGRSRNR